MVVNTYNFSFWEADTGLVEFKVSLGYTVSSGSG